MQAHVNLFRRLQKLFAQRGKRARDRHAKADGLLAAKLLEVARGKRVDEVNGLSD